MNATKKLFTALFLIVTCISCKVETETPVISPTPTPPGTSTGNPTPPVTGNTLDFSLVSDTNLKVSLSDYKDKVVVLFFFGSGCSSCKAVSPDVQTTFVNNYDIAKVQVIGLDTWDGNLSAVQSFKTSSTLTFPLLLSASGVAKTFETTYDRLLVVDKKGVIRFKGAQLARNDIANAKKVVDEYLSK